MQTFDSTEENGWINRIVIQVIGIVLLGFGLFECILGLLQFVGMTESLNKYYNATGTFYNPGPYCCYISMLTPLALFYVIADRKQFTYWIGFIYLILSIIILPVLLGRTGWIAAVFGCLLTFAGCKKPNRVRPVILFIIFLGIVIASIMLYYMKPESALGRCLLWRIGISALLEHPLLGVGWDYVAGSLGDAQEIYFHNNPESIFSEVCGTPSYAFNEFLQIGIAFGIPCMLLFISVIVVSAIVSWRKCHFGITGCMVSFAIVCSSSYPLQFPEFIVSVGLLVGMSILISSSLSQHIKATICVLFAGGIMYAIINQRQRMELSNRWSLINEMCMHELDSSRLDSLIPIYGHTERFLFDYGKALREAELYDKSTKILLRGLYVSSDPMFLNIIGRNYHDVGEYGKSEHYYLRAIDRLPGRMYPHYLLAKLYADPAVADSLRFSAVYEKIIEMKPKVMSPAILQMREELNVLHDSIIGLNVRKTNTENPIKH